MGQTGKPEEKAEEKERFFDHFRVEASANTIPILRAIVNKGTDSLDRSPYLVNLRVAWKNWGLRTGAGGTYNDKNSYLEGFKDSRQITTRSIQYRVGADYRVTQGRRFSYSVGLDWVSNYFKFNDVTDSGFDILERVNLIYSNGGGISLNANWWLSRQFSLGIESSMYYLIGQQTQGRKFVNFPELNDDLVTSDIKEINTPVALFATWKF